jgi:hypothetical protein
MASWPVSLLAAGCRRRLASARRLPLEVAAGFPPALALALVLPLAGWLAAEEPQPSGLVLQGQEAEEFLRAARVVERKAIGKGITRPEKLTLSDDHRTLHGVWKTIDVHKLGQQRMERGWEFDFRDSWRSEVAAYELDKILGLGLVPPTVERHIEGRTGSLQLWVEQSITEDDRGKRKLEPPHLPRWNNQLHNLRLLHQLTFNTDFQNVRNVLVDPAFKVYAIDNSRAFRIQKELLAPDDLQCFSRSVLERLRALDAPLLEAKLGAWLEKMQIEGLLARRDAILAIVDKRVKEKGEGVVLFY